MIALFLIAQMGMAHPCMTDAEKLCQNVEPGEGRIGACLKAHKSGLSAECNARIAEFKEEADACHADVQKLCPGTQPGKARHDCMMAHKDQVSQPCKDMYAKLMEHRQEGHEAMAACRPDVEKLCKGTAPGGGRIIACLQQHQAELSAACAAVMEH